MWLFGLVAEDEALMQSGCFSLVAEDGERYLRSWLGICVGLAICFGSEGCNALGSALL